MGELMKASGKGTSDSVISKPCNRQRKWRHMASGLATPPAAASVGWHPTADGLCKTYANFAASQAPDEPTCPQGPLACQIARSVLNKLLVAPYAMVQSKRGFWWKWSSVGSLRVLDISHLLLHRPQMDASCP